ncbi:MAG TPA: ATP-binding protein [Geobacteraceae bacterium]|jgi:two-component system nitrogen regulation sensor histidine kinase GlnL|nr:ATP-binding protein [Geobacteraceae bacterium]
MNDTANHVKEYVNNVIDSVGDGVIVMDNQGIITLMNPAAEEITGFSRRQAQGNSFASIFGGEYGLNEMVEKTSCTGMTISDYENLVMKKSFQATPVSATTSPLLLGSGERIGTILVLRDLTNIRELEDAVRQADRLSTLGTLAAGLAHEIKNPLGGIKGAAQLLERELPEGSELGEYIKVMLKEVGRVNKIVEELLHLTTPRKLKLNKINLNQILGDIIMLQKRAADKEKISFTQNFDLSIPPFLADEALLTQLFLNLIKNAVEAVDAAKESGAIKVTSRMVSDYSLTKKGERPSRFVAIDISDDGPGMEKEQLEHIFTPFFTTKSKGTGLGLAICQKIVSEHRGMIKVDSEPGKGTTFTAMLPLIL